MSRNRLAIRTVHDDAEAPATPRAAGGTNGTVTPDARTAGSVVVGVDGSPTSRAALRWATNQAALLDAPLTLCHTHPVTGLAGTRRVTVGVGEDVLEHAVATASQHLDESRIVAILGYGDPARVLAQVSSGARVLVIGTHGYFAHGASLFEPLSLRIIAGARCPVVVHPMLAGLSGPFAGHVVVGVDGSAASQAALAFAYSHASAQGRPVAAVHIAADPAEEGWGPGSHPESRILAEPRAEQLLSHEVEPWAAKYPGVITESAIYDGRAVPGLLRASAGAELLVIGDRGRGGVARTLLGSVAQHMVGNATCPVAVIRSPKDTDEEG